MGKKDGAKNRRKSERFESEGTLHATDVAEYLEGLAKGLREGKVFLGEQGTRFEAMVGGDIDLEIEARHRKKKSRIELSLSFRSKLGRTDKEPEQEAEPEVAAETAATIPDEMSF